MYLFSIIFSTFKEKLYLKYKDLSLKYKELSLMYKNLSLKYKELSEIDIFIFSKNREISDLKNSIQNLKNNEKV